MIPWWRECQGSRGREKRVGRLVVRELRGVGYRCSGSHDALESPRSGVERGGGVFGWGLHVCLGGGEVE